MRRKTPQKGGDCDLLSTASRRAYSVSSDYTYMQRADTLTTCTSTEEQRKSESEGVRGKAPRGAPSSAREVADLLSPVILKTFSYDPTSARPYPARVPRVPG